MTTAVNSTCKAIHVEDENKIESNLDQYVFIVCFEFSYTALDNEIAQIKNFVTASFETKYW